MSSLQRHRDDIQGLRALAIVPVVLFHAGETWLPGGFVGVDVFFVISGYLITRILLHEIDLGAFSLVNFYERRIRRLFPALYLVLTITILAAGLIFPPDQFIDLGKSALATIGFVSNFYFYTTAGYFGDSASLKPLLHTWSLAVEEQFYLTFPILLLLIHRHWKDSLSAALWIGAIGSLALCLWVLDRSANAAFYMPLTRSYELLIGSIVAVGAVPKIKSQAALDGLSVAGLIMIVGAIGLFSENTTFPGMTALLPCVGAALILYAGEDGASIAGRWLSYPIFIFFGAISYSLYLWHWPFIVFMKYLTLGRPSALWIAAALLGSISAALLSFKFVERPFLAGPKTRKTVFVSGGLMASAVGALALIVIVQNGIPDRFSPAAKSYLAAADDFNHRRTECHNNFDRPFTYESSCSFGKRGAAPTVAVWSDSFGAELAVALGEQAEKNGEAVRQLSASACPPSLNYIPPNREECARHNRAMLDHLLSDPGIKTVVLAANYTLYPSDGHFLIGMRKAVKELSSAGKRVAIVYPVPKFAFPVPQALAIDDALGAAEPRLTVPVSVFLRDTQVYRRHLDGMASDAGTIRIQPATRLCDNERCAGYFSGTGTLYFDDRHLSVAGSRFAMAGIADSLWPTSSDNSQ